MKKGLLFVLIILVSPLVLLVGQEEQPVSGTVFITSVPINAQVFLDGALLLDRTPLLLTDLEEGIYQIELRKEGFGTGEQTFRLKAGQVLPVSVHLGNEFITLSLPDQGNIVLNESEVYEEEHSFAVENGVYSVVRDGGYLHLDPVFPDEGVITALNVALPILLILDTVMTFTDFSYQREGARSFSPATVTAYGLTLGALGLRIGLQAKKNRYLKEAAPVPVSALSGEMEESSHFTRGEDFLSLGKLEEALVHYTWIIENRSDSVLFPEALYKIGKIHTITEDFVLAEAEFKTILDKFPQADVFDKTCKSLSDVYLHQEKFEPALEQLSAMVFYDPLFSREEIDLHKCEILEAWYFREDAQIENLITSYIGMVSRYPVSVNSQYYRYKAAYFLHRAGKNEAANVILESIETPQEELKEEIRQLKERVK